MKQLPCIKKLRDERGDFLIESLIGVLLIGIVGTGIAMTAKKVNTSQVLSMEQNLAISNMAGVAKGGNLNAICTGAGVNQMGGFVFDATKGSCDGAAKYKTVQLKIENETIDMPKPVVMEAAKQVTDPNDPSATITLEVRVGQNVE